MEATLHTDTDTDLEDFATQPKIDLLQKMSKLRFRIQSAGLEIQDLGILRIQSAGLEIQDLGILGIQSAGLEIQDLGILRIQSAGIEIKGIDINRIQSAGLRIVEFRPSHNRRIQTVDVEQEKHTHLTLLKI
jgi:hypothetical protein